MGPRLREGDEQRQEFSSVLAVRRPREGEDPS